jgi:hypothetical protein
MPTRPSDGLASGPLRPEAPIFRARGYGGLLSTLLTSGNLVRHIMIGGRIGGNPPARLWLAASHAFEYCAPPFTTVRHRPDQRGQAPAVTGEPP